jgi:hypothetical protein
MNKTHYTDAEMADLSKKIALGINLIGVILVVVLYFLMTQ